MIPKIKNILYATDLSANSAYAFRYAMNSAARHGAVVHILHVLENRIPVFGLPAEDGTGFLEQGPAYVRKLRKAEARRKKRARDTIRKRLEDFCREELRGDADLLRRVVSVDVREGNPADRIAARADELLPDLIIVGSHRKGSIVHALSGSVAEKIVHRTRVPVFIVPLPGKTVVHQLQPQPTLA